MLKWKYVLIVLLLVTAAANAQTVQRNSFSVQLNEHTIVLDSAGNRMPYNVLLQKLSGGNYTLDPIKNASGNGTGQYRLRAKQATDEGRRDTKVVQQGSPSLANASVGELLPSFTLYDADSVLLNSDELKGRVVVLNFWFTQCKPCMAELPELNALVDSFSKRRDVVFLAPDFEKRDAVKRFRNANVFRYRILPEASELVKQLSVSSYPTHLIIGRNGKVIKRYSGGLAGIQHLLKRDIEEALKQ